MIKEFRDFLMRGNLVELAVAFVMGLAFAVLITPSSTISSCRSWR
jgi:large conductance mechanosensitive channel